MNWEQIIISALSGILGTIIGSFIAYLTMAKQFKYMTEQEIQKQKRDDELYLKRKREDLYAKMYDFLMRFEKDVRIRKSTYMAEETKDLLNIIQIRKHWICFMIYLENYLIAYPNIRRILKRLTIKITRKS